MWKRKRSSGSQAAPANTFWEPSHVSWEDSEDEFFDYETMEPDAAAEDLKKYLMGQYISGKMDAKQTCITAWYAQKAGLTALKEISLRPDSQSSHFARKLRASVDKDLKENGNTYFVQVPGYTRHSGGRSTMELSMLCPHEVLYEQLQGRNFKEEISEWETQAPAAYFSHPVKEHDDGTPTLAYGLFLDGVQYCQNDSLIAITMTNLVHNTKVLLGVVRKRMCCGSKANCVCGTWCTMYPIYLFLAWSMEALAKGKFPCSRHCCWGVDLSEISSGWLASDGAQRLERSGTSLGFKGICLQIRGDLMELTSGLGFTQWTSSHTPCLLCKEPKVRWMEQLQHKNCSRPLKRDKTYEEECSACQILVDALTPEVWMLIQSALTNSRQFGGRVLSMDLPGQHLKKNDRLEPAPWFIDVWDTVMPPKVLFWRTGNPPLNPKHRNPLLSYALGTTLVQAATLDVMHTWALGIYQNMLHVALWQLIDSNCYGEGTRPSNAAAMGKDLREFYKSFDQTHPGVSLTKCNDFSMDHNLGGTPERNKFRAKAAETLGLMRFAIYALAKFQGSPGFENGPLLLQATDSLLQMYTCLGGVPVVVPQESLKARMRETIFCPFSDCSKWTYPKLPTGAYRSVESLGHCCGSNAKAPGSLCAQAPLHMASAATVDELKSKNPAIGGTKPGPLHI
eukprot:616104-Amphidinium_carterae.1